jgi:hypothetical protein
MATKGLGSFYCCELQSSIRLPFLNSPQEQKWLQGSSPHICISGKKMEGKGEDKIALFPAESVEKFGNAFSS